MIKGDDGLYYKLNTDGMDVEAEQTEYNSLNGSIIRAKSITATKIAVDDLVAFDATIAGFNITDEAIYSGVKESALNTTRGIYLGKDGQLAFGDSNNYLRFYKDSSGRYKLEISAESMNFSSTGASVEDTINDINDKVDSVVSVEKSEVTYQVGTSGTVKPTGAWLKDMPSVKAGQFLWTRTLITYSDKSVTELFSVSSMGTKGETGTTGLKSLQPTRNWNGTFTIVSATVNCTTDDFNRTPVVGDTFTNLDGSSNTGTWKVTAVSGYTVSIQLLSYVSSKGDKGDKGDKGAAGADAIIISITSSSGTIFKNNSGTTILTAHVYKGGVEQAINTNGVCGSLGTVKWYKGTSLISAASAINVSAADVNNTQIYTCQLEG